VTTALPRIISWSLRRWRRRRRRLSHRSGRRGNGIRIVVIRIRSDRIASGTAWWILDLWIHGWRGRHSRAVNNDTTSRMTLATERSKSNRVVSTGTGMREIAHVSRLNSEPSDAPDTPITSIDREQKKKTMSNASTDDKRINLKRKMSTANSSLFPPWEKESQSKSTKRHLCRLTVSHTSNNSKGSDNFWQLSASYRSLLSGLGHQVRWWPRSRCRSWMVIVLNFIYTFPNWTDSFLPMLYTCLTKSAKFVSELLSY
jgi:hypothetical protein